MSETQLLPAIRPLIGPDVRNAFVSQGNNLIGASDGSTGFTNGVNNDKVGTVASPLNALLAPLGNYGGPTQTFALLPGSPAINAANNCVTDVAHCGDANIPQLTSDQRGFGRQVNGTVDIGSFRVARLYHCGHQRHTAKRDDLKHIRRSIDCFSHWSRR